jgi:hypothetical protein
MATFTNNYETATADTPILSSAWNANIDATKERFEKHDHSGIGESGLQITLDGLADDVKNEFAGKAQFDTHNHSGGESGPQIGRAGLDSEVDGLLNKIAALETQVAELSKPAIISLSTDTAPVGATIFIKGINFVAPVTVTFGAVNIPVADIELQTNTTIKVNSVPAGGDGNVTVETTFGTSVSAEFFSTI